MRYTYAISALRDKRARLAGAIEMAERKLDKDREILALLDATLRLFHPDADPNHITAIRPRWRGVYFRSGERQRLCLEALRDAGGPLTQARVAEYLVQAKGMDPADRALRAIMVNNAGVALYRLAQRGAVRKIITEPDVWWKLMEKPLTRPLTKAATIRLPIC